MTSKQSGFTLIELMIVVAIVGILSAVAVPAYQNYTLRAQVSEGVSIVGRAQAEVGEYYQFNGAFPTADQLTAASGLDFTAMSGTYVSGVSAGAAGVITATFGGTNVGSTISTETLIFTPTEAQGIIQWTCTSSSTMDAAYLPKGCTVGS